MHSQISEIMKNRDSDDKGSTISIFSLYIMSKFRMYLDLFHFNNIIKKKNL